jgi:hypothetical protein
LLRFGLVLVNRTFSLNGKTKLCARFLRKIQTQKFGK